MFHKKIPTMVERTAQIVGQQVRQNKKPNISGAMRQAGYTRSTANTLRVTKSPSWQALLDKYLPLDRTAELHGELTLAFSIQKFTFPSLKTEKEIRRSFKHAGCEVIDYTDAITQKIVLVKVPDNVTRARAIEGIHRVRGLLAPEKIEVARSDFDGVSDEELIKLAQKKSKSAKN